MSGGSHAGVQIIGKTLLEQAGSPRTDDGDGGHVGGVENTGPGQNGQMLLFNRRIPQWHVVAAKVRHVGAVVPMPGVEGGGFGIYCHDCSP
jgi:hypothetical protein